MNKNDITLLYDYNYWATQRLLTQATNLSAAQFVAPSPNTYGSLLQTLVHTLDTEYGWRIICQRGQIAPDIAEDALPTFASLTQRWREEEQAMREYIAGLSDDDLVDVTRYTVGDEVRVRVRWHCLLHVVNHGTQHRSEVAAMLTAYNLSPGDLDFTLFLREQA